MADVHLVVQKKGAADIVLPSKLTGILSAGGYSLITAEQETELGRLCSNFPGIAERVEPEDTDAFIAGLTRVLNLVCAENHKGRRAQRFAAQGSAAFNTVARQYALEFLNKDAVLSRFERDLLGWLVSCEGNS